MKLKREEVAIPRKTCIVAGCIDKCAIGKKMCMYHLNKSVVRKNLFLVGVKNG